VSFKVNAHPQAVVGSLVLSLGPFTIKAPMSNHRRVFFICVTYYFLLKNSLKEERRKEERWKERRKEGKRAFVEDYFQRRLKPHWTAAGRCVCVCVGVCVCDFNPIELLCVCVCVSQPSGAFMTCRRCEEACEAAGFPVVQVLSLCVYVFVCVCECFLLGHVTVFRVNVLKLV